jgi:prolyl-tRNA synthetase
VIEYRVCQACDYTANLEVAAAAAPIDPDRTGVPSAKKVYTPNARSIDEVSKFLSVPADILLKSLIFVADGKPFLAVVRGDHELNETKLRRTVATSDVRPAETHEVRAATGAEVGFAGPVGFTGRILIDHDAAAAADAIVGANQSDHHL